LITNTALYRSDDGGTTWRQMAANDSRIHNGQNGYNCGVYVDPQNPDIVYTINTSSFKSTDGGNTFTGFKGAPGGDDPQQMWIDPTNGQRMLLGVDQGATVSLDGGKTWSSWYNQSTEQVYHISVDNSYPYWVYATQQDAGSVGTRSRGDLGEVTPWDWYPTAGYEFGFIVADPLNPKIVYARGEGSGSVNKITYPNGQYIDVSPTVDPSSELRGASPPMGWSPFNQHELMVGFQYLMATTDGGSHWKKLSPDLTYPKGEEPPPAGAARGGGGGRGAGRGGRGGRGATPDSATRAALAAVRTAADSARILAAPPAPAPAAGGGGGGGGRGGGGGSIAAFSPSTVTPGTIWVGTSNGLVKVTKDGGAHWVDASIPDIPNGATISSIDASHLDSAAAYVAVDHHTSGDYKPYLYRTHDYGKTWTEIVNGLAVDQPSGSFARVLRADTKKAGLLFAGTESSMYVSFDDGDVWQSLQLNLPNTSYRDMVIKDNDLVVGTYGRGIWILDDYSPLRQMTPAVATEPAHLFKPGDQIRVRRNVNGDTPLPPEIPHAENPPLGVIIYYHLAAKPAGEISLDVSDAAGNPVRHYSSAPIPPLLETPPTLPDFWLEVRKPMSTDIGTNRMNWDMRYDPPYAASHSIGSTMGAVPGETVPGPEGPLVAPGTYTLKLTVDGKSYTQTVAIRNDPRSPASAADLRADIDLQMKVYKAAKDAHA
ncbi:MAG TPA: hypothetical protein VMH39_16455, partial [Gemmatimonadaceae bacterium]|nr:hypothetical protein [Gemmatimonadaceae bacterium]